MCYWVAFFLCFLTSGFLYMIIYQLVTLMNWKNDKLFWFIQNSSLNKLPKFFRTYLYIITCNSIFMKIFIYQLVIKLTLFTLNKILLYFLFKYFYLLLWKIVYLLLISIYLFFKIVSTSHIDHTSSISNLLDLVS